MDNNIIEDNILEWLETINEKELSSGNSKLKLCNFYKEEGNGCYIFNFYLDEILENIIFLNLNKGKIGNSLLYSHDFFHYTFLNKEMTLTFLGVFFQEDFPKEPEN
jgi:hypothetical protein